MGNNSYSIVRDMKLLIETMKKYPNTISYEKMFKDEMNLDILPPIIGRFYIGRLVVMFTSCD